MHWIRYLSSKAELPDSTCSYYKVCDAITSFLSYSFLLVVGFWSSSSWIGTRQLYTHRCPLLYVGWAIRRVWDPIVLKPGQGRSTCMGRKWSLSFVSEGASSRLVKSLCWGPSIKLWEGDRCRLGYDLTFEGCFTFHRSPFFDAVHKSWIRRSGDYFMITGWHLRPSNETSISL